MVGKKRTKLAKAKESRQHFTDSISVRLAIGFGVVLCVFGGALLANLHYLQLLKRTSEEVRIRQQIRREALKVGRLAEHAHQELMKGEDFHLASFADFERAYSQMAHTLQVLADRGMAAAEWAYLNRLAETMGRLRSVFSTVAESAGPDGSPIRLSELQNASAELVAKITDLNVHIGQYFDVKTYRLESEAQWFGELSLNITRAIFALALVTSMLAVYFTHRSIVCPINNMVQETKKLAGGELRSRMLVPASAEFRTLAESFNRMAAALETNQRQLIEAEKMATIGRFAAGVAHEINNPIAVILGYVKTMMAKGSTDTANSGGLKAIEEEAEQCKNIIQDLLNLARPPAGHESELIDLHELVSEVVNLTRVLQISPRAKIRASVPEEPVELGFSRARLRQVILNLVSNALEALQDMDGGELIIEAHLRNGPEGATRQLLRPSEADRRFVVFRFIDNGPGIPEEDLPRLFEPFFTTKPRGTGLGLAITYSIVEAHGGYIDVTSTVGHGTTFALSLPVLEAPGEESPA